VAALSAAINVASAASSAPTGGRFEWVEGFLVKALQAGEWVLLENANLCNPTVRTPPARVTLVFRFARLALTFCALDAAGHEILTEEDFWRRRLLGCHCHAMLTWLHVAGRCWTG
jgi:hypothetical protein